MQFQDNLLVLVITVIFSAVGVLLFYFIKNRLDSYDKKLDGISAEHKKDTDLIKEEFAKVINVINSINNELTRQSAMQNERNAHIASQITVLFEKSEKHFTLIHNLEREVHKIGTVLSTHLERIQ